MADNAADVSKYLWMLIPTAQKVSSGAGINCFADLC